ncbi:MAG: nucleoside phosphorylase [Rikenellaceae bacterium]
MKSESRVIPASELILNSDNSIFHLHLKPEDICDNIILVGDPARVDMIGSFFDEISVSVSSREFKTIKGLYKGCEIMVLSTGIGTDNIDIVLNELDALANIDFNTRKVKEELRSLNILRIGTTGGVQEYTKIGDLILSEASIGIDCLAWYYENSEMVRNKILESEFVKQTLWSDNLPRPYAVNSSFELVNHFSSIAIKGVTITAPGFYSAQGRELRLQPAMKNIVDKFEKCDFNTLKITNIEMESAAICLLSTMLGHNCATICLVVAQRKLEDSNSSYKSTMEEKIELILEKYKQFTK